MKRFILSFFVFFASAAYVAYQYMGGSASASVTADTAQNSSQVSTNTSQPNSTQTHIPTPTPAPTPTPTPTPAPTPAPKPKGQYADGTYKGSSADAYYGMVQVEAIISGGKLTGITFLQYPNDRSTSRYINEQAMPLLKEEAIQAQSADVSGVSGATDTSLAFRQSLSFALAQAKS